jgi:hypothetical protein
LIVANIDSESIWEQIQTRNRPLLRFLESELTVLNKKLKERKITIDLKYQSNKPTLSSVFEDSFSSESEQEDIEVESSNSEGDDDHDDDNKEGEEEGEVDHDDSESEDHESPGEEDDMENFLDEIDLAEDRRLTELENPASLEQVEALFSLQI